MNICKGICIKFKAKECKGKFKYLEGQKLCATCSEFIISDEFRCPCCSTKLRVTAKERKSRERILKIRKKIWIWLEKRHLNQQIMEEKQND